MNIYVLIRRTWATLYCISVVCMYAYALKPAVDTYGFWAFIGTLVVFFIINSVTAFMWFNSYLPQATRKETSHGNS